jgi:hypothetical protein
MRIKRWAFWGVLLGTPVVMIALVSLVEANAEAKARAFCDRFPIGSSLADVATAAQDAGDPRHRMIRTGEISIAYIGVPPFSRHVCAFTGESGKVTKVRYVYID